MQLKQQSLHHQRHHVQLTKFMTLVEQLVLKLVTAHHLLALSSAFLAVGVQVDLLDMKALVLRENLVQVRRSDIFLFSNFWIENIICLRYCAAYQISQCIVLFPVESLYGIAGNGWGEGGGEGWIEQQARLQQWEKRLEKKSSQRLSANDCK